MNFKIGQTVFVIYKTWKGQWAMSNFKIKYILMGDNGKLLYGNGKVQKTDNELHAKEEDAITHLKNLTL